MSPHMAPSPSPGPHIKHGYLGPHESTSQIAPPSVHPFPQGSRLWPTAGNRTSVIITSRIYILQELSSVLWLGIGKSIQPVKIDWMTSCWWGYLSGARYRLSAYGPADANATPKSHHLLPHLSPDWFYLSGTGLPRLSWKRGHWMGVAVVISMHCMNAIHPKHRQLYRNEASHSP